MLKKKEWLEKAIRWPVWDEDEVRAVEGVIRSGRWWAGAPADRSGY